MSLGCVARYTCSSSASIAPPCLQLDASVERLVLEVIAQYGRPVENVHVMLAAGQPPMANGIQEVLMMVCGHGVDGWGWMGGWRGRLVEGVDGGVKEAGWKGGLVGWRGGEGWMEGGCWMEGWWVDGGGWLVGWMEGVDAQP